MEDVKIRSLIALAERISKGRPPHVHVYDTEHGFVESAVLYNDAANSFQSGCMIFCECGKWNWYPSSKGAVNAR